MSVELTDGSALMAVAAVMLIVFGLGIGAGVMAMSEVADECSLQLRLCELEARACERDAREHSQNEEAP